MHAGSVTGWLTAALLGFILYFAVGTIGDQKGAIASLQSELTAEKARVQTLRQNVTKATTAAATARQELEHALKQDPAWAGAPVPVPVADSLCRTLRCVKPGGVPAPSR